MPKIPARDHHRAVRSSPGLRRERSDPRESPSSNTSFATAEPNCLPTPISPPSSPHTNPPLLLLPPAIMNAFRVARAARPAFNTLRAVQRRGYADVAPEKIQLSLALPHQVRWRDLCGRIRGGWRMRNVKSWDWRELGNG